MKLAQMKESPRWLTACCFSLILSACGGGGGGGDSTGGGGSSSSESSRSSSVSESSSSSEGNSVSSSSSAPTGDYAIVATVAGLEGELTLMVNGDPVSVLTNSTITLTNTLADASAYEVTVESQPEGQTCRVPGGTGTISGDDATLNITCNNGNELAYSVVVEVSGLEGALTLTNQTETLEIVDNGVAAFPAPLVSGTDYRVIPTDQPSGQMCQVTNDRGTVNSADITDITVSCGDRSLALEQLADLQAEFPSIVSIPVSVTTYGGVEAPLSGTPVEGLTTEDFEVLESGQELGSESFFRVDPITEIPFTFDTVLMLDISSSISPADIERVKETARNFIADPITGVSNLRENQQVAIRVFDDTIRAYQAGTGDFVNVNSCFGSCFTEFSRDKDQLFEAIDAIERGGASTNLYGAIVEGAGLWNNSFSLDFISFGAMVLVTDGDDTSNIYTLEEAQQAVEFKTFFAVPVGADLDLDALESIAGSNNLFAAANYEELNQIFDLIDEELNRQEEGKYLVYYASPSRGGEQELLVEAVDNANTQSYFEIVDTYLTDSFSDIGSVRQIVLDGSSRVYFDEPVTWDLATRWSNDPANYTWEISDPNGLLEVEISDSGDQAVLTPTKAGEGSVSIVITDENWSDVTLSETVAVRPSRIPQNLLATSGNGQVVLDWDAVPDASQYNIYQSTTEGTGKAGTVIPVTDGEATGFTLENVENGTTYYFVVTSLIEGVESNVSNEVTAEPTVDTPAGFTLTVGSIENTLAWSAVEGATGYTLYWNTTGGVTEEDNAIQITDANATGYVHTLPDADASYYYRLSASDSTSESWLTEEQGLPQTPMLTAEAGDAEVILEWSVDEDETYRLYWSTEPGAGTSGSLISGATPPYTHSNRTNETTYYYTVAATNDTGTTLSEEVSAMPVGPWIAREVAYEYLYGLDYLDASTGLAVGDNGEIVRTTNGGADWERIASGVTAALRSVIFLDADTALAVGSGGTILHSDDVGLTWSNIAGPDTTTYLYDVATDFAGNLVAVGQSGAIWYSSDDGLNWTARSSGVTTALYSVTFIDEGVVLASGDNATTIRSEDGGEIWSAAPSPYSGSYSSTYVDIHALDFVNSTVGYAVGRTYNGSYRSAIWKTEDGGDTWTEFELSSSVPLYGVSFSSADNGRVVGPNNPIWVTTDGGETWAAETSGVNTGGIYSVYQHDAATATATGLKYILRTGDGNHEVAGESLLRSGWTELELNFSNHIYAADARDSKLFVTSYGRVFYSEDLGGSWTQQSLSVNANFYAVQALPSGRTLVAGQGGNILITDNDGDTWSGVPSGTSFNLHTLAVIDGNAVLAAGAGGTVLRSTDGGNNWSALSSGTTSEVRAADFASASVGTFVTVGGAIYRTDDGGDTWVEQVSGVTTNLHAVIMVSSTEAWAAGNNGVLLHTTDSGATWNQVLLPEFENASFLGMEVRSEGLRMVGLAGGSASALVVASEDGNQTFKAQETDPDYLNSYLLNIVKVSNDVSIMVGRSGRVSRYLSDTYSR